MEHEYDIPGFGLEDQALDAEYLSSEDTDWDSAWEIFSREKNDSLVPGVLYIPEYHPAWKQADGTVIAIKDMETKHIKNCIKLIYKHNGTWRHQYLRVFETELRRRKYERT